MRALERHSYIWNPKVVQLGGLESRTYPNAWAPCLLYSSNSGWRRIQFIIMLRGETLTGTLGSVEPNWLRDIYRLYSTRHVPTPKRTHIQAKPTCHCTSYTSNPTTKHTLPLLQPALAKATSYTYSPSTGNHLNRIISAS